MLQYTAVEWSLARKYRSLRSRSLIFDTVDDCSRTGCGLETDRAWLTVSATMCVSVFLLSSLAVWGRMKRHPNKSCLLPPKRGKKGEWAALLYPPRLPTTNPSSIHPSSSSWMPASWMAQRGRRRKKKKEVEGRMGGTVMFREPLCFCPMSEIVALAWGLFPYTTTDAWVSTDVKTIGPYSVYV